MDSQDSKFEESLRAKVEGMMPIGGMDQDERTDIVEKNMRFLRPFHTGPKEPTPEEIAAQIERKKQEIAADRLRALRKEGFPERAIRAAQNATGPGALKASQLIPHVTGDGDGLLLLLGPTGRGKTVMATLLAMARQEQELWPGMFRTAFSMFSEIKSTYGGNKKRRSPFGETTTVTEEDLVSEWSFTAFLIIDEVQTRSGTTWEDGLFDEIVIARYGELLPTVLIANFTLEEAQANLGPRIMDRARESGGIVNCNWESYRK